MDADGDAEGEILRLPDGDVLGLTEGLRDRDADGDAEVEVLGLPDGDMLTEGLDDADPLGLRLGLPGLGLADGEVLTDGDVLGLFDWLPLGLVDAEPLGL